MKRPFVYNRTYDKDFDVRDHGDLIARFTTAPADGVLWALVAPRRAGKTWALKSIHQTIGRGALLQDLRYPDVLDPSAARADDVVLCDEPGHLLNNSPGDLLDRCERLHRKGAHVVIALTPREFEQLRQADPQGHRICGRAVCHLPLVSSRESMALLSRDPRAGVIHDELPAAWRSNLCLLELLGELWCGATPPTALYEGLRAAIRQCSSGASPYLRARFTDSLMPAQRELLRRIARRETPPADAHSPDADLLVACGFVTRDERGRLHLADPIIAASLEPLRIHHLSDIHVGPKSADVHDVGGRGAADPMGTSLGQKPVRDRYVDHVRELSARGEAPHVVALTGDLVEWAIPAQYEEFNGWLHRVREVVEKTPHPGLSTEPRIVAVGGNHDVSWSAASRRGSERTRHQALADALGDVPHPQLHRAPEDRGAQEVTYEDAGLSIALLGSSELGGSVETPKIAPEDLRALDEVADGLDDAAKEALQRVRTVLLTNPVEELLDLVAGLPEAAREARAGAMTKLLSAVARIDPGMVHERALEDLKAHAWSGRAEVKIALLHHPPSAMSGPELRPYAGLLNASEVKKALIQAQFALALHGHAHTGWLTEETWVDIRERWVLRIAAAPSLGSTEVRERHGYNVIEVRPDLDDDGTSLPRTVVVRRRVLHANQWTTECAMGPFLPGASLNTTVVG